VDRPLSYAEPEVEGKLVVICCVVVVGFGKTGLAAFICVVVV